MYPAEAMIPLYLNCEAHPFEPTWNKAQYLLAAAKRLGLEEKVLLWKGEPDVRNVLNIEPYTHFLKGLSWTGVWTIDLLLNNKFVEDWDKANDVFLAGTTIKHQVQHKTHLLFQACDPIIHRRVGGTVTDAVICGTLDSSDVYTERIRCLKALEAAGFSILGEGKGHSPQEYVKRISKARVQFIRSMKVGDEGEIAQRFFECLAIGPVLINYVPDLLHTGLIEDTDYLAYRNDEEMIAKMHILVNNPPLRERMARAGREKALLYHSYDQRLAAILNIINEFSLGNIV